MAGGTPAGRLEIEILANVARLQKDLDNVRREVGRASADIGKSAKAANDNLRGIGKGAGAGVVEFSREVARLKAQLDPAWGAMKRYKEQVALLRQALREGAITHKQFVAEMRNAVAAMRANEGGLRGVTASSGRTRMGMQQLSFQLNDISTGFASGQKASQIFAQQMGQTFQAVQLMAGGTSRFANFMLGPWGLAISAGAIALIPLITKLLNVESAADKAGKALKEAVEDLNKSLTRMSDVSRTYTEAGRVIAGTLGEIARVDREIGALQDRIDDAPEASKVAIENLLKRQIAVLEAERDELEGKISEAQSNARTAAEAARIRELQEAADEKNNPKKPGKAEKSDAEKERERQTKATLAFIEALEKEVAAIGKTQKEVRLLEVARQVAAAQTQDEKDKIQKLSEAREREIAALQAENQAKENRKLEQQIEQERRQLDLIGLTGAARERMVIALAEQADVEALLVKVQEAEAAGNTALADQLREQIRLRQELADIQLGGVDIKERYKLEEESIRDLSELYRDLFTDGVDGIWDSFKRQGIAIISDIAARWTLALLAGRSGGSFASLAGSAAGNSPLAALFGGFGAANDNLPTTTGGYGGGSGAIPSGGVIPTSGGGFDATLGRGSLLDSNAFVSIGLGALAGSLIGGGTGSALGSLVGSFGGQALGSTLGFLGAAGGPIGAIAGGLLGSIVGGLFGSTKRGSAILNGGGITGFYGNSQSRKDAAAGLGGSVLDTINQIAEALGADVNAGAGKVSIGIRKGNIVVDPQGRGYTKTSKFGDLRSFGQDEEAAIKFAIQDLIRDGVLTGISAASQRLLGSGGDIEKQIEKAALIEAVPKLLAQRLDPLGYELEQIDEKFRMLASALREGGGTAEQFAQAEQLYMLERQDAIEQFGAVADQLKSFLESLGFGGNSPLSLRQQLANANAALDPFVAQIAAGQTVDQGAFTSAAQAVLDISRLINASSGGFFTDFDRIRGLTEDAIFNAEANTTVPGDAPDIFGQQTAENTSDIANILGDVRAILERIAEGGFIGGGGSERDYFDDRSFAA